MPRFWFGFGFFFKGFGFFCTESLFCFLYCFAFSIRKRHCLKCDFALRSLSENFGRVYKDFKEIPSAKN